MVSRDGGIWGGTTGGTNICMGDGRGERLARGRGKQDRRALHDIELRIPKPRESSRKRSRSALPVGVMVTTTCRRSAGSSWRARSPRSTRRSTRPLVVEIDTPRRTASSDIRIPSEAAIRYRTLAWDMVTATSIRSGPCEDAMRCISNS
jgi:hypothetical protein